MIAAQMEQRQLSQTLTYWAMRQRWNRPIHWFDVGSNAPRPLSENRIGDPEAEQAEIDMPWTAVSYQTNGLYAAAALLAERALIRLDATNAQERALRALAMAIHEGKVYGSLPDTLIWRERHQTLDRLPFVWLDRWETKIKEMER